MQTLTRAELDAAIARGEQVIDLRSRAAFVQAHIPGSIGVPATNKTFSTFVGWFVQFHQPVHVVAPEVATGACQSCIDALRAIGVDDIRSVSGPDVVTTGCNETLPTITAADLAVRLPKNILQIIDIRGDDEYREGHITGAPRIHLGQLPDRLGDIPRDRSVVLQCGSGYRAHVGTSVLRKLGFRNVISLVDGIDVWSKHLPVTKGVA